MHEERPDIEGILRDSYLGMALQGFALVGFIAMVAVWIIIATPVPA